MAAVEATRLPGRRSIGLVDALGLALIALGVVWIVWNFAEAPSQMTRVVIGGVSNGALYALIALGYTMVYGIIELINFAHGDLFMLGSVFAATMLESWLNATESNPKGWVSFAITLPATMIFCAVVNVIIERLAYRRLRNAPKLAPLITAVGVSFILQNIGLRWSGSAPHSRTRVISQDGFSVGPVVVDYSAVVVIGLTIPLLLAMVYIVRRTRAGKAMRATAQDPDAARLMGIDVDRTIAFTFALGGALAGAAGLMFVEVNGQTRYDAGFRLGLIAFTAAVLGGVGNLFGAVVGGLLIGVLQGINDGAPHGLGQEWTQTFTFAILILLMVFRPSGIFGTQVAEKV